MKNIPYTETSPFLSGGWFAYLFPFLNAGGSLYPFYGRIACHAATLTETPHCAQPGHHVSWSQNERRTMCIAFLVMLTERALQEELICK